MFAAVLSASLLLAGCTTPAAQDNSLRLAAAERAGLDARQLDSEDGSLLRQRVDELLAATLSREDAVKVALLNNPGLARRFAQLRIDAAERVRASRPPNPSITLARFSRGSEREDERGVAVDLLSLLTWPATRGAAHRAFDAAREDTLRAALALTRDVRIAWTQAIAAESALRHAEAVRDAADTGRLYAERLNAVGNASRLDALRARAFFTDADLALADARLAAQAAREQLALLLGVADAGQVKLPAELPPLPEQLLAAGDAEQRALDNRADLRAAKAAAEAAGRALNIHRATRVVNVLEGGYHVSDSNQDSTQRGFELSLELPLFDLGSAGAAEARARQDAAVATVLAVANAARTETRLAWANYRRAHDGARRYRDEVLPLTSDISREMILRHNGMLVGPFDLLEQARAQAGATARWQAALRDFWLADAQLAAALTGAGATGIATTASEPVPDAPRAAGGH
jgi:outer membrane protein TolC